MSNSLFSPQPANLSAGSYRPEIDGIRCLAVLSVILFHGGVPGLNGGFLGVDIFFVVSGFLITSIIIKDLEKGTFSLISFYERRARRIAPALITVIVLTMIASFFVASLPSIVDMGVSAAATALFLANIRFMRAADYFAVESEERPFLHMWSLAVEEQFYIVFPILFLLLWKHKRSRLQWVILGCALLSLLASEIGWRKAPDANFYLPITRAWELLAGVLLALQMKNLHPGDSKHADVLASLGLVLLLGSILSFEKHTPSPSLLVLFPVVGTYLLIRHAGSNTLVGRLLSWRPFVRIGLISFSVYLLHQPILAFARISVPSTIRPDWFLPIMVLLSLPLGYLCWRFVEQPARLNWGPYRTWSVSIGGLATIAVLGLVGHFKPSYVEKVYFASLTKAQIKAHATLEEAADYNTQLDGSCRFAYQNVTPEFEQAFDTCLAEHGPGIMFLGASHADDLLWSLGATFDQPFQFSISKSYCRPHSHVAGPPPGTCQYDAVLDFAKRRGNDLALVIYTTPFFTLYDDYGLTDSTEGFHPALVDETVDYLAELQEYSPVVFLGPRRTPGFHILQNLSPRKDLRRQIDHFYNSGVADAEDQADNAYGQAARSRGVPYISLVDALDLDLPKDILLDDKLMFHDWNHLNVHGELIVGQRLKRYMTETAESDKASRMLIEAFER